MNPWLLGLSLLSFEASRAEQRIARAMSNPPDHYATGPMVSVIIPAYNEEGYIQGTLAALQNQSYINKEVIVVDNLSQDQTPYVAHRFGAKVVQQPDYNIAKSRNWGAKEAQGEILVFLDADSIPEHNLLEECAQEIYKGAALVYPNKCCHDSKVMSILRVARGVSLPASLNISGAFIALPRAVYNEIGGYDESIVPSEGRFWIGEDVDFTERIIAAYPSNISYLRWSYVGTSGRRQNKEGFVGIPEQNRAVREEPESRFMIITEAGT